MLTYSAHLVSTLILHLFRFTGVGSVSEAACSTKENCPVGRFFNILILHSVFRLQLTGFLILVMDRNSANVSIPFVSRFLLIFHNLWQCLSCLNCSHGFYRSIPALAVTCSYIYMHKLKCYCDAFVSVFCCFCVVKWSKEMSYKPVIMTALTFQNSYTTHFKWTAR